MAKAVPSAPVPPMMPSTGRRLADAVVPASVMRPPYAFTTGYRRGATPSIERHFGEWHDRNAGRLEARSHCARNGDRCRLVAMNAQRVDFAGDPLSVA